MKISEFEITEEKAGIRIDINASEISGLTRSQIHRMIERGLLKVNGHTTKTNYKTKTGDIISIISEDKNETLIPEDLPVEILFKDDFLIVINKPPDMVIYPGAGHDKGTLMNAVAYQSKKLSSIGAPLRPGVVHRLDKDTSGVIVVALDDKAYYGLIEQFRTRTINRKYKALIYGSLKHNTGEISAKIGRSASDRKKMSTEAKSGKEAVTTWKVLASFKGATLVEAKLGTGRTHQIRVHFSSIGHPVLGDKTYGKKTSIEAGNKKIMFSRQMLHAELLGFIHPITSEYMEFSAEMPEDMQEVAGILREIT